MRNKEIRVKTVKAARSHAVSLGGMMMAVILLIIGIAAFKGGYTNVGPVFMAFGALVVFISIMPLFDVPGWAMAVILLGAVVVTIIFAVPYVEAMTDTFDEFLAELPSHIWEWLLEQAPQF